MSSCELCGKEFKFPYLLLRHLNKKNPCVTNKVSVENLEHDKLKHKNNDIENKNNDVDNKNNDIENKNNDVDNKNNDVENKKDNQKKFECIRLRSKHSLDGKAKRFKCIKCERTYVRRKEYSRHILNCTGLKPLQCPTCKKFFSSKQSKYEHIKNVKCSPEEISEPHKNSVYLLIEREFMASKQNIFKIGRSVNISNRTRQYPKGSQLLVVLPCIDSCVSESNLQRVFCEKFIQRRDIGSEYYEGLPNAIIKEFINNVDPHF